MKILHFVHNYYGFSGASRQAKNMAIGINTYHKDVEQCFFSLGEKKEKANESELFSVYSSKTSSLLRIFYFIIALCKYRPDIVHMHGADFALLVVAKLFRVKVYWKSTLYKSDDFETLTLGKIGHIKKCLIRLIDCNNALTKQMHSVNKKFLTSDRLVTIPNGVEIPKDTFLSKEKKAVIISAIIPRKGVVEGINFFNKHLKEKGYLLYIMGPNNKTIDGYSSEYISTFNSKLSDSVRYLGEVDFSVVSNYLNDAQYLIHLSESEGMPNIVLEAMSHACYPITLSMDGLYREIYDNGVSGINVEKKFELIDAINHAGYQRINDLHSFSVISNKTYIVYLGLLSDD